MKNKIRLVNFGTYYMYHYTVHGTFNFKTNELICGHIANPYKSYESSELTAEARQHLINEFRTNKNKLWKR